MHQDIIFNYDYIVWNHRFLKGRRCRVVDTLSEMIRRVELENGYQFNVGPFDIRKAKSDAFAVVEVADVRC